MLKFREYLCIIISIIGIGVIYYQDRIISEQIRDLNKPIIIETANVEPEYLIPAPKEHVEAVISKYYEKNSIVSHNVTTMFILCAIFRIIYHTIAKEIFSLKYSLQHNIILC